MLRRLRLVAPIGVANLVAAVAVFCYQNVLAPTPGDGAGALRDAARNFAIFCAVTFPLGAVVGRRILAAGVDWRLDGRRPSDRELVATLAAPRRIAAMAFAFWIIGAVTFSILALARAEPALDVVFDAAGTVLGGVISALLSFLLVEWTLRPYVADALAGGTTPPSTLTIGIGPRILVSWAVGSGVPLFAIAAVQIRPQGRAASSPAALFFLAVVGIVVGAVMLLFASRAVVAPIREVRAALQRVQEGDLAPVVVVDDGGEIGQLQAGVNRMVAGLRERRLLEDLFGRHVGTEVARRALAEGSELGGEQRSVSVLFVDIVGSTGLAQTQSPTEVVGMLNAFFSTVVDVVGAEGGWVNKFEGDGALCVFGAPSDQPDHPTAALRAARRLRDALQDVHAAGIGVSSGTVVAGNVGAAHRLEYTVIGDPVNEAARLTEAAKEAPDRLLASEATVASADEEEAARWVPAATLHLRGRREATRAYAAAP